ncbi:MAG: hypothetical protein AAB074_10730 [Planctomycetota bacterium]
MQLWFPPLRDGAPPAGHVALRFHHVISASFMTRRSASHFPHDWPRLMNEDRLEPLPIWNGGFSFNDDRWLKVMMREAGDVMTRHGFAPGDAGYHRAPVRLAFGAGPAMAAVAAERLSVHAHGIEVPAGDLSGLHGKWWDYWREYWKKRRKREALPYDPVCEVTMPAVERKAYVPADREEVERLRSGDAGSR